jgi:hypothetical protein
LVSSALCALVLGGKSQRVFAGGASGRNHKFGPAIAGEANLGSLRRPAEI